MVEKGSKKENRCTNSTVIYFAGFCLIVYIENSPKRHKKDLKRFEMVLKFTKTAQKWSKKGLKWFHETKMNDIPHCGFLESFSIFLWSLFSFLFDVKLLNLDTISKNVNKIGFLSRFDKHMFMLALCFEKHVHKRFYLCRKHEGCYLDAEFWIQFRKENKAGEFICAVITLSISRLFSKAPAINLTQVLLTPI